MEQLKLLQKYAEENNMLYYIGQAYRFFGEFHLTEGQPRLATPCLIKALSIFHDLEKITDRDQARCLAAVSAGQELMPRYIELILKCGKSGRVAEKYVYRLAQWKDTREVFWVETSSASLPSTSQVFNIVASIKNIAPGVSASSISEEIFAEEILDTQVGIYSVFTQAHELRWLVRCKPIFYSFNR